MGEFRMNGGIRMNGLRAGSRYIPPSFPRQGESGGRRLGIGHCPETETYIPVARNGRKCYTGRYGG